MSSFFNKIGQTEAPMEMADAMRWPAIDSHMAAPIVNAVLEWEDRWAPITDIEDYRKTHVLWDFESAEGYYLNGSH